MCIFSLGVIFLTTGRVIYIIAFVGTFVMKTIILLRILLWIVLRSILVDWGILFRNLRTIIIRLCHFSHRRIDLVFVDIFIALVGGDWSIFKLVYEFIYLINIYSSWVLFIKYFKYLHIFLPIEVQFILTWVLICNSLLIVLIWTEDIAFHKLCNGVCINK